MDSYHPCYRIQRIDSGAIELDQGDDIEVKAPTDVGTGKAKEDNLPLSEIITTLNDRFGTDFTEEDRLFFEQIKEKACNDDRVVQTAKANPLNKFEIGIKKMVENFMIQRMVENDKIVNRYMDDMEFQNHIFPLLATEIFTSINNQGK